VSRRNSVCVTLLKSDDVVKGN